MNGLQNYIPLEQQQASEILDKLRDLIISYTGLTLQEPEMFPQPPGKLLGPAELVPSLMSLSTLSGPYLAASASHTLLDGSEIEQFLQDLARRFEPDNEIDGVLGPVVAQLCFHPSVREGFTNDGWRSVVSGLEALISVKPIAAMITRLPEWNPENVPAPLFEKSSLLGPLLSLGVFEREWVSWIEIFLRRHHLTTRSLAIHREDLLLKPRNTATRGDELCDCQSSRNAQDCSGRSFPVQ